jgi:hypothetical protein
MVGLAMRQTPLLAVVCFTVLSLAGCDRRGDSPTKQSGNIQTKERSFTAAIEVRFDAEKLTRAGIATSDAAQAVESFMEKHRTFKLVELQSLKITALGGEVYKLKDVATVDVEFTRQGTEKKE